MARCETRPANVRYCWTRRREPRECPVGLDCVDVLNHYSRTYNTHGPATMRNGERGHCGASRNTGSAAMFFISAEIQGCPDRRAGANDDFELIQDLGAQMERFCAAEFAGPSRWRASCVASSGGKATAFTVITVCILPSPFALCTVLRGEQSAQVLSVIPVPTAIEFTPQW